MDLENIRAIGKETRARDLSDLVTGERVLVEGFGTYEKSGVFLDCSTYDIFDGMFLVAVRSHPMFNEIIVQEYVKYQLGTRVPGTERLEEGIKRGKTIEIHPGRYESAENRLFTIYDKLLDDVGL